MHTPSQLQDYIFRKRAIHCLIILFWRNIRRKISKYWIDNIEPLVNKSLFKIVLDFPFDVLPLRSLKHALFCSVTYDPICPLDIALLQLFIMLSVIFSLYIRYTTILAYCTDIRVISLIHVYAVPRPEGECTICHNPDMAHSNYNTII